MNTTAGKELIVLSAIMSVGFLALLVRLWRTRVWISRLLASSQIAHTSDVQALVDGWGLNVADIVLIRSARPTIFCFGFLKPRICLSTGLVELLSSRQLQAVLLHEDCHRRQFDPLRILIVETIGTALFFLPVIQELREQFKINLELQADHYAAHRTSNGAIAGALHRLIFASSSWNHVSPPGTITAGLSANDTRVAALLGEYPAIQPVSSSSLLESAGVLWVSCLLLMI